MSFEVMKGFLSDYGVMKEGEVPETLPPEEEDDVTDEEQLDDKSTEGGEERGDLETDEDDLTMAKDVAKVDQGAKRDVKEGYTQDIMEDDEEPQEEETKGFSAFNSLVNKSIDVESEHLTKWNIGEMVDQISQQAHELTLKEMSVIDGNFGKKKVKGLFGGMSAFFKR